MSRVGQPVRRYDKPVNVYTALAFIGFLATAVALVWMLLQYRALIGF